jgi:hypothetical protein
MGAVLMFSIAAILPFLSVSAALKWLIVFAWVASSYAITIVPTLYKALADAWAACNASLRNLAGIAMTSLQKITFTSFAK